jgi:GST-like protein
MTEPSTPYTPPKVWTWNKPSGGQFANINRPVSGATHDKDLPVGRHPLQLYSLATPNGVKVTVMLEELLALGHAGAEYDAWLVRINEGHQFSSGFVAVNPNSKIPALLDRSETPAVRVFESGAILMYLAAKTERLLPADTAARWQATQWLMFQMGGVGPMFGQLGFFHKFAGKEFEDKRPRDRYVAESRRLLGVLNTQLKGRDWLLGTEYSIADIAVFPWVRNLVGFYDAGALVGYNDFAEVQRVLEAFVARPAVQRGLLVPAAPT